MCLTLIPGRTSSKVAEKDIVCYKQLIYSNITDMDKIKTGDTFVGVISRIKCEGVISISSDDRIYFCTNNPNLNGTRADDTCGYLYSWVMDFHVEEIIVGGEMLSKKRHLVTRYREMPVEIGKTYNAVLIKTKDEFGNISIEKGLHSYAYKRDAVHNIQYFRFNKSIKNRVIAKCIIPKGSMYYEGKFAGVKSYASNTIKYVELVDHV